jgi:hypothetical protein
VDAGLVPGFLLMIFAFQSTTDLKVPFIYGSPGGYHSQGEPGL